VQSFNRIDARDHRLPVFLPNLSPSFIRSFQVAHRLVTVQATFAMPTKAHELHHEAVRRAGLSQPITRYTTERSLLLPAPNNIIFELFNTILKEVPSERLLDYITQNLKGYLSSNWTHKITRNIMRRMRQEQAVDLRLGLADLPVITCADLQQTKSSDGLGSRRSQQTGKDLELERRQSVDQVYEQVMWRIKTNNVSQICSLLLKIVLDDGYKTGKLKAETYAEIGDCFEDWRSRKLIKLYSFGDAPANEQKLILSSTTSGDLSKWIANYIDGSEKRKNPDLIRTLAGALRDKTKNCVFITNETSVAIRSIQTGAVRFALVVDRARTFFDQPIEAMEADLKCAMVEGKLYVVSSLACVEFAPDPASEPCC